MSAHPTWVGARLFDLYRQYVGERPQALKAVEYAMRLKAGIAIDLAAVLDAANLASQHVLVIDGPADLLRVQLHEEGYSKSVDELIPPVVVPPFDHCFVESQAFRHGWEEENTNKATGIFGLAYSMIGQHFVTVDMEGLDREQRREYLTPLMRTCGWAALSFGDLAERTRWVVVFIHVAKLTKAVAAHHGAPELGELGIPGAFGFIALTPEGGVVKASNGALAIGLETVSDRPAAQRDLQEVMSGLASTLYGLGFVNARNVRQVRVDAPASMNKARERRGRLPFASYHVVDIGETVEAIRRAERSGLPIGKRMHFVRGHFKVRKTGQFWWSQHVRGEGKQGVVVKDYDVGPRLVPDEPKAE